MSNTTAGPGVKGRKKSKKELLEIGTSTIAENLYLLNKEAKEDNNEHSSLYYELKDEIIELLKQRKLATLVGHHRVGEYKKYNSYMGYTETRPIHSNMYCIIDENNKEWQFHSKSDRAVGDYLGELTDFSAEKKGELKNKKANIVLLETITGHSIKKTIQEKEKIKKEEDKKEKERTKKLQEIVAQANEFFKKNGKEESLSVCWDVISYTPDEVNFTTFRQIERFFLKKWKNEKKIENKKNKEEKERGKEWVKIWTKIKKERRLSDMRRIIGRLEFYYNEMPDKKIINKALKLGKKRCCEILSATRTGYGSREALHSNILNNTINY